MMRIKLSDFAAFLTALGLNAFIAQPLHAQIITDLLVNDEPDTITFTARAPSLHVFSPGKFLVVWEDDRAGDFSSWANFFDASLQHASDNFAILGGEAISPKTESCYTVLQHRTEPSLTFLDDDHWVGYRQSYEGVTAIEEAQEMDSFLWPWCGTGFLGVGSDLVRTDWGSVYVVNFGGALWYRLFDNHDVEIGEARHLRKADGIELDYGVLAFSLAVSSDSARVWIVCHFLDVWSQQSLRGLYIGELSTTDGAGELKSVLADSIPYPSMDDMQRMHTLAADDSTLAHFLVQSDSLLEMRFRADGTLLERRGDLIPRPDWIGVEQPYNYYPQAVLVSNKRGQSRELAVVCLEYGWREGQPVRRTLVALYEIAASRLVDFSAEVVALDGEVSLAQSGEMFLTPEHKAIVPAIIENQTHLLELDDGAAQTITRVSDPSRGANQSSPQILREPDTDFWISWLEAGQPRARRLDANGNLIGSRQPLPATEGLFLQNGERFVARVPATDPSRPGLADIQIWRVDDWQLLHTIALDRPPYSFLLHRLDEARFFFYYAQDSLARLDLYDATGAKTESLAFARNTKSHRSFAVTALPDGRYWLCAGDYYLWDPSTMSVFGPVSASATGVIYPVTPDRFIFASFDYSISLEPTAAFALQDTTGATLLQNVTITANGRALVHAVVPLRDDHFLILFQHGGALWARVFDRDFNPRQPPFQPFPNATPKLKTPQVAVFDDRIVFAASDVRPGGIGSDVFASIYDLEALITGVEARNVTSAQPRGFALLGLSPNPLRPGEVLRVDLMLDRTHAVELRLYNLVGQMVHQFAPQPMATGSHAIDLQLPRLPAGVYFLHAQSNGRRGARKFVMLR